MFIDFEGGGGCGRPDPGWQGSGLSTLLCIQIWVTINKKNKRNEEPQTRRQNRNARSRRYPRWSALPFLFYLSKLQLQSMFRLDGVQFRLPRRRCALTPASPVTRPADLAMLTGRLWWCFALFTQDWRLVSSSCSANYRSAICNCKQILSVI
jgi:hypothetical protein